MLGSWGLGFFFLSRFFNPKMVVFFNYHYYWVSPFWGMLGLTILLTLLTVLFIGLRLGLKKGRRIVWSGLYSILWMGGLALQVRFFLFNLGICCEI